MGKHRDDRVTWRHLGGKDTLAGKTLTHLKDLLFARDKDLKHEIAWRKRSQESHEEWMRGYDERILTLTQKIKDIKIEISRR